MFLLASGDSALRYLWDLVVHNMDHPVHFAAEIILFGLIVYLWNTKSYKKVDDETLTQKEEDQLIAEWTPEPLVNPETSPARTMPKRLVLEGEASAHVKVDGVDCLNFTTTGFLGYHVHPKFKEVAKKCAKVYGVGACGPRGFYGSIEPHMQLEKKLAEFMKVEDCVIFSSEFQTIASVIPAFSKPGDYLVVDKGVSMAIQNGVLLSRSEVIWFNRNDMKDLERALQSLGAVFARCKHRVFVVVEGLYTNSGHLLPLDKIMKFKETYPFRIILEEAMSVGVLGKEGVGVIQHFNVPPNEVELVTGSLGNAFGGVGGFAIGTKAICNHMRLNCSGYVFSCSLPPYVSSSCITAVEMTKAGKEVAALSAKTKILHKALSSLNAKKLTTTSSSLSPLVHINLVKSTGLRKSDEKLLDSIVEGVFAKHKVVLCRSQYVPQENFPAPPSIKLAISVSHTEQEILDAVKALNLVAEEKI